MDKRVKKKEENLIREQKNNPAPLSTIPTNPFDGKTDLGMEEDFADLRLLESEFQ